MKIRQSLLHAAVVAALVSGPAVAASTAPPVKSWMPVQERFHLLDVNGDGFVSRNEVQKLPGYAKAFTEADVNHDGKLDMDEFVKAEAIYDRIEAADYVEDSVLTAKVKTALLRERQLNSLDVSVETFRGNVLLAGFVADDRQRDKAIRVASAVSGVRSVKDGLVVKAGS